MNRNQIDQMFETLGIRPEPLPYNYTPEEFGKQLLSSFPTPQDISYASSTELIGELPKNASEMEKPSDRQGK